MRRTLCLIAAWTVLLAWPAFPHHSHGNYQMTEYIQIEGTVTEIHWLNPHSWIYLEVRDSRNEPAAWALEGANVAALRRGGWREDSIQVGDRISVRCNRLKDGSNGCLLGYITTQDGIEKLFD